MCATDRKVHLERIRDEENMESRWQGAKFALPKNLREAHMGRETTKSNAVFC